MDLNDLMSKVIREAIDDAIRGLVENAELRVASCAADSCDRWDESVKVANTEKFLCIDNDFDPPVIFVSTYLFDAVK